MAMTTKCVSDIKPKDKSQLIEVRLIKRGIPYNSGVGQKEWFMVPLVDIHVSDRKLATTITQVNLILKPITFSIYREMPLKQQQIIHID